MSAGVCSIPAGSANWLPSSICGRPSSAARTSSTTPIPSAGSWLRPGSGRPTWCWRSARAWKLAHPGPAGGRLSGGRRRDRVLAGRPAAPDRHGAPARACRRTEDDRGRCPRHRRPARPAAHRRGSPACPTTSAFPSCCTWRASRAAPACSKTGRNRKEQDQPPPRRIRVRARGRRSRASASIVRRRMEQSTP